VARKTQPKTKQSTQTGSQMFVQDFAVDGEVRTNVEHWPPGEKFFANCAWVESRGQSIETLFGQWNFDQSALISACQISLSRQVIKAVLQIGSDRPFADYPKVELESLLTTDHLRLEYPLFRAELVQLGRINQTGFMVFGLAGISALARYRAGIKVPIDEFIQTFAEVILPIEIYGGVLTRWTQISEQ